MTYGQIASMLASHFDVIYYVDSSNGSYIVYTVNSIWGEQGIRETGDDFFMDAAYNVDGVIYSEDRDRIATFLGKDYLITSLENQRQLIADYRMVIDGKIRYTRMTVIWATDKVHFIVCVENRDEDVRREHEHLQALKMANEMARRDELTGTRNKNAYREAEKKLQEEIDIHRADSFAIVLCDINELKLINDTQGHKAGDIYIRRACKMICTIFAHSPVFRIGGDEFVVILTGNDFTNREDLIGELHRRVNNNLITGEGPVLAAGLAEYQSLEDRSVEDVFERADTRMYEDKSKLKSQKLLQESFSLNKETVKQIPKERRTKLDTLYSAFALVSEGTYVYLCDMKYDYSRWSASAVDLFNLPSEYMYGAGDIWEERIHPEDREAYRKGIDDIFMGNSNGHDMQYRAQRADGGYDVCTCRGVVIRDPSGEPDYFAGTIRNHGIQGHLDTLTGLRNQYGFFEDLDLNLHKGTEMIVSIVGISKFSEINEVYGYHFGNRVLQKFARKLFDFVGNTGHTYRIDGTKFAIISHEMTVERIRNGYKQFRDFFRSEFELEGKRILLGVAMAWGRPKGLDVFVRLAGELDDRFAIVLVGTSDEVDKGLPERIISIHQTMDRKELAAIYTAADLFVNPTRQENFPTVNIEALACGTPVLTYRTGGSPEVVDPTCGSVVAKDDYDALKAEILRITEERPFSGASCRERALQLTREKMCADYERLLRELVQ